MVKSKKVVKASLAAVLMATSVVPVAVAAEEAAVNTVAFVVVESGNQLVKFDTTQYAIQYATGGLDRTQTPKYVVDSNGNIYLASDYAIEYATGTKNIADALASLAESNKEVTDVTVVEGKVENGQVVPVDPTPGELTVTSVNAITTAAFAGVEKQLEFAINDEEEAADVAALKAAGYEVKFLSSIEVTADGKVEPEGNFSYQVIITKDGKEFKTAETQVLVQEASSPKKITAHSLKVGTEEVKTVVLGEKGQVSIAKYETLEGKELAFDATKFSKLEYKSSNTAILAVSNTGAVVPVAEGTATIIVTADGVEQYEISVTVKAEERVATTATAENVSLSTKDNQKKVAITVTDQYGDPISGALTASFGKTGTDAIATLTSDTVNVVNGKVDVTVTAKADAASGTDVVTLKNADKKEVGKFNVTYTKAGALTSFELRVKEGSVSKDNTIDFATTNLDDDKKDNSITLELIGKDSAGVVGAIASLEEKTAEGAKYYEAEIEGRTFTVKLSGKTDAVVVDVDGGALELTATETAGTVTVSVTEGTLPRATYEVKVENNTKPELKAADIVIPGATVAAVDNTTNQFTVTYANGGAPVSTGAITFGFNTAVKVESLTIGGKALTSDQTAELLLKADENYTIKASETLTFQSIGTKIEEVIKVNDSFELNVVNESGLKETFKFKLVVAPVAPAAQ